MKKEVLITIILLSLLIILPFVNSATNETISDDDDEETRIAKAYECLEDRLGEDCSTSVEENIFALLSTHRCQDEVEDESKSDNECWPKSSCTIKSTAQAILALDEVGEDTEDAQDWLLEHTLSPTDLDWFLEIESTNATTCSIYYGNSHYTINIGEDKKINTGAGSCLTLVQGGWWFRIAPTCYDQEFEISCDKDFLTTLLFQKDGSSTFHISQDTSSSSAEGTTTEKVGALCFSTKGTCDYEGSLWATLALNDVGVDIQEYIPYLITMSKEYPRYIPESFLYILTGYTDFRTDLLLKQKGNYWDESGNKFYDTAMALYPFQYEDPAEKSQAKEWLLEVQGKNGCWDSGNIKNNAFILYSIWPELRNQYISDPDGEDYDDLTSDSSCENAGYFCMSSSLCQGKILIDYDCLGSSKCCDTELAVEECVTQGGEICAANENCVGGVSADASDTDYGEICCIEGTCKVSGSSSGEQNSCELNSGTCKSYECNSNEEESVFYSCDNGDICCVSISSEKKSYWWIWILFILIIIVALAIIFREKLKPYWYKLKSSFGKKSNSSSSISKRPPGFPPSRPMFGKPTPRSLQPRITPRRILPPKQPPQPKPPVQPKKNPEIEEVLKKLKEIGK